MDLTPRTPIVNSTG